MHMPDPSRSGTSLDPIWAYVAPAGAGEKW